MVCVCGRVARLLGWFGRALGCMPHVLGRSEASGERTVRRGGGAGGNVDLHLDLDLDPDLENLRCHGTQKLGSERRARGVGCGGNVRFVGAWVGPCYSQLLVSQWIKTRELRRKR